MLRFVGPIARYTVLEAVRNRLWWLLALGLVAATGGAAFLGEIAITEAARIQSTVVAAAMRLFAVFLVAGLVVASMVRESHDKVLEVLLAKPLPRASYVFGKLAGFAAVAACIAFILSTPLLLVTPAERVALWGLSLACELLIVVAASVFCVVTLHQVITALAAVLAFYLLARSIGALQIMAGAVVGTPSWSDHTATVIVQGIALLLPSLQRFAQTTWLVDASPGWNALGRAGAETLVYVALLTGAALFDLYRQDY